MKRLLLLGVSAGAGHQRAAETACLASSGHVTLLIFPFLTSIIYTEPMRFVPGPAERKSGPSRAYAAGTNVRLQTYCFCGVTLPWAPRNPRLAPTNTRPIGRVHKS